MAELSRKERDKQLRKADILKAAEFLFATKGYHEATIQDIAKRAQYGAGTVYLYFKDKNDLYFSILEEKIRSMIDLIKEQAGQEVDARKKLEIFIYGCCAFFEKHRDFFHIFASERNNLQRAMDKGKIESSSAVEYGKEYAAKIIRMAQGQNVIVKEYSPYEIADILFSILASVVSDLAADPASAKRAYNVDKAKFVCSIFLRGVEKR